MLAAEAAWRGGAEGGEQLPGPSTAKCARPVCHAQRGQLNGHRVQQECRRAQLVVQKAFLVLIKGGAQDE